MGADNQASRVIARIEADKAFIMWVQVVLRALYCQLLLLIHSHGAPGGGLAGVPTSRNFLRNVEIIPARVTGDLLHSLQSGNASLQIGNPLIHRVTIGG
jgi:hypothetical protein